MTKQIPDQIKKHKIPMKQFFINILQNAVRVLRYVLVTLEQASKKSYYVKKPTNIPMNF